MSCESQCWEELERWEDPELGFILIPLRDHPLRRASCLSCPFSANAVPAQTHSVPGLELNSVPLSSLSLQGQLEPHLYLFSLSIGHISSCFPVKQLTKLWFFSSLVIWPKGVRSCLPLLYFPITPNTLLNTNWMLNRHIRPIIAISHFKFKRNPWFFSTVMLAL